MRFPINVEVNDDVWSGTCPSIRGVDVIAKSAFKYAGKYDDGQT